MMKSIFWGVVLACVARQAHAVAVETTIEPIVGYERVQKLVPTVRSRDRLVYGVRATAGIPYLAAEAEYLRSTDTEAFPDTLTTISERDDRVRLGLRSTYRLGSLLSAFLRAGVQARQVFRETTVGTLTTEVTDPIRYNPYAGAGARVSLGSKFWLTADVTTVFNDFPNMQNNDYMVTAGFVVSIP